MLVMKNDCVELDGLVCTGDRATHLWFCRRDLYPYWREAWLRRASPPSQTIRKALPIGMDTRERSRPKLCREAATSRPIRA